MDSGTDFPVQFKSQVPDLKFQKLSDIHAWISPGQDKSGLQQKTSVFSFVYSHSPPGHVGLNNLQHGERRFADSDKGSTEEFSQSQHLDHLHHLGTDTFNANESICQCVSPYKTVRHHLKPLLRPSRVWNGNTHSRMRTAKANLYLAGGGGAGGLCFSRRMRVSSRCFRWLSFKKSSKRLNLVGAPLQT